MVLAAGTRLGPYEIISPVGKGAMGFVYSALDPRLDRQVAIKLLPGEMAADPHARERLRLEAIAAAALDHPYICKVYEIREELGELFLVMEFVNGRTLQQRLAEGRMPLPDILRVAGETAEALQEAHSRGFLHRDLKPSNIMLTAQGHVKIMDFGLATRFSNPLADAEVTRLTVPGTILGTPLYMSPEQATGAMLDARSDLFSFGVILYEMITGVTPFRGESGMAVIASLLRDAPARPGTLNGDIPRDLEEIVLRCLNKAPEGRFQNMSDLRVALDEVRTQTIAGSQSSRGTGMRLAAATPPAARKRALWPWIAAGLLLAAGLSAAVWSQWGRSPVSISDPGLARLTSDSGLSTDPAISPDGKLLAFASDRSGEGKFDIWVEQTAGGEPVRMTNDPANDSQPAFSPDGSHIAFRSDRDGGGIYEISSLGGAARKLADGGYHPRYSPDGKWIAYWTGAPNPARNEARLHVVGADGGAVRDVQPDFVMAAWPVWSPDGRYLLFIGRKDLSENPNVGSFGWWVTPFSGGAATRVRMPKGYLEKDWEWIPDAWVRNGIVYSVHGDSPDNEGIFEVSISTGNWQLADVQRRVTQGITHEEGASFATDGRMAFASVASNVDLYSLRIDADRGKTQGAPERLTRDVADDFNPSLSADGARLAFQSVRAGSRGIWVKDLRTGEETVLLKPLDRQPFISPDGKLVYTNGEGGSAVLAAPFGGGSAHAVCQDCGTLAAVSPAGGSLLYSDYSSHSTIGVFDIASGSRRVIRHARYSAFPRSFSPDGKWIAAAVDLHDAMQIFVVPYHGDRPTADAEWIAVTDDTHLNHWPHWSPDGGLLYFESDRDGYECIWGQRLRAGTKQPEGEPFPVAHFHGASAITRYAQFAVAGERLVVSLDERTGNIWMLGGGRR